MNAKKALRRKSALSRFKILTRDDFIIGKALPASEVDKEYAAYVARKQYELQSLNK